MDNMHQTSIDKVTLVTELVRRKFSRQEESPIRVIEVGGTTDSAYRELFQKARTCFYQSMNVHFKVDAPQNAEIILDQVYTWPEIDDESYDVVISGQVFEHVEFYWATLLEMRRILKKGGLLCITAPSHWREHRSPFDCQRFYADGLMAMMKFIGFSVVYAYAEHAHLVGREKCDAIVVAEKPIHSNLPEAIYKEAHSAILKLLPSRTVAEVSRGKPTLQSSVSSKWQKNMKPGNAVSGLFTGGYSFHTTNEQEPWWMVDLRQIYELEAIKIFNRDGPTAERARQMDILLSNDLREWRTLHSNSNTFGGILDGQPLVVKANSAYARYVRLQLRERNSLHLDQVQVFAVL